MKTAPIKQNSLEGLTQQEILEKLAKRFKGKPVFPE